ncbi:VirB4 family type IV secretion system protein [Heyndrickxia camelliae]|uniref:Conjugal transfer protein n=1 Tax=Heyndrickxia camelliae TaxID=1707093 RepID=A0A2N3LEJ5_9BACI|nr:DUF87 domain-containing protein [Heyndrickxia camelliae]PKR83048.1 conjugal transfer protein [Heyndrickxia camelliae]
MKPLLSFLTKEQNNTVKVKQIDEIKHLVDSESIESRYPFVFELNREYIAAGGNYIKPYVIVSYPSQARGNWLSPLKKLKGNITISQFIDPANGEQLNNYYNETIKNKEAELLRTLDYKKQEIIKREIETAKKQLAQALDDRSSYVYLYTYILIQANTLAELKSLEENLNRVLIKVSLKGMTPHRKINDAYWSCLPIGQNLLKEYTYAMTNSISASSFFPFDDNEICDLTPTSTIEGINKETNSWIAIDYKNPKKTLNRNKIGLGTSGVGKSTYQKVSFFKAAAEGEDDIYIIDPEDEYSPYVRELGGTVIDVSSASNTRINPFQIFSNTLVDNSDDDGEEIKMDEVFIEGLIKQRIQRMKGWFKSIKPGMSQVEISIVSSESIKLYTKFREVKDINKMKVEDWPILEDLLNSLDHMRVNDPDKFEKIEDFYFILEDYVYGSSTLFNGYTNINLDSKIVSFNLKPLQTEKDVQSAAYFNIFNYLWDIITNSPQSVQLFCDEFHFLLLNEESADFFFQAYKRFRKYNAGATVTTQQVEDLLKAPNGIGEAIIGNSYTKVIFGLEGREVDVLINKLKIPFSEKEVNFLRAKRQGEALIIYGSKRAFLQVKLTMEEMRLLNPKKYKETTNQDPFIQPDWKQQVFLSPNEVNQFLDELRKEGEIYYE